MPRTFERHTSEEAPLYVRWNPDRSPFAIEMRLDLVERIGSEIERGNRLDVETGGVLIGSFPSTAVPTLRIDDFIPIARRADDGQIFMLNPDEHERFAQARWRDLPAEKTAVGFFRSHLRSGPLKPSIADRGLLSEHFREVYVLLLVEGAEQRRAAFFVAARRELPDQPSVPEFRFDEAGFQSLPELQTEEALEPAPPTVGAREPGWKPWWALLFVLVLVACAAIVWALSGVAGNRSSVDLSIRGAGRVLTISWNHAARQIANASGAALVIADGANQSTIQLGEDDLILGAIDYKRSGDHVTATLTLQHPSGSGAPLTANWPASQ
ncbi:MAG: hypothetical protein ACRD45_08710 [Bryobacteraceae bacterium]